MKNCQVSSKLSPPGKTGQSWGCVIYKNSRRVAYIRSPWEEYNSPQPRFPVLLLLLVARKGVQGPFPTCVPNLLCVSTQHPAAQSSSPPFLGEDLEGRSMISLHSTLCAGYFCMMQAWVDTTLFRAWVTALPSLPATKQKAVHPSWR